MATSDIERIIDDTTLTDQQKIDGLYNKFKSLLTYLTTLHTALANETYTLNDLMDANGNNPEEHHAKTMVLYGRKLSVRDVLLGVKDTDESHVMIPEVDIFTGLDAIISQNDWGRVPIRWDCWEGMDGIWKTDSKPETQYLAQDHMLGSKVTMPTIQNLDNDGKGAGTNTYKIKAGYVINGWKLKSTTTWYLYDDSYNDFQYKISSTGVKTKIQDKRVFAFGSNLFRIPFNPNTPYMPAYTPYKAEFILNVIPFWYDITFVVRHGTASEVAPCKVPLHTKITNTVTLPLTTLITMDEGYAIDTDSYAYGQWTTVDPNTGTTPPDPDDPDDQIPELSFNAGESFIVGTDLDARIRTLFLKIKAV